MAEPTRSVSSSQFWRCRSCGTPNPTPAYVTTCLGCGKPRPKVEAPAPPPATTKVVIRPRRGRWLWATSWLYAAVVLAALVLIRWVGDAWWGVILLLFMPRWLFLAPVLALAMASAVMRCPGHWVLQGATGLVVAGPLMGASMPFPQLWERPTAGERVRVATYNLGMGPIRVEEFRRWVERQKVDVICVQEGVRDDPRLVAFLARGWHLNERRSIASRFPIVAELPKLPDAWETQERYSSVLDRARLRTPGGNEFVVASVHLPTIRPGFERFFRRDVNGLKLHVAWWGHEMARVLTALAEARDLPTLVGGDFNMPSDDSTMAALRATFRFAFEEAGWGYGYTRPSDYPWVRIDHLLASPEWAVTRCRRGPDFGSDHLPLVAEFVLPSTPAR